MSSTGVIAALRRIIHLLGFWRHDSRELEQRVPATTDAAVLLGDLARAGIAWPIQNRLRAQVDQGSDGSSALEDLVVQARAVINEWLRLGVLEQEYAGVMPGWWTHTRVASEIDARFRSADIQDVDFICGELRKFEAAAQEALEGSLDDVGRIRGLVESLGAGLDGLGGDDVESHLSALRDRLNQLATETIEESARSMESTTRLQLDTLGGPAAGAWKGKNAPSVKFLLSRSEQLLATWVPPREDGSGS